MQFSSVLKMDAAADPVSELSIALHSEAKAARQKMQQDRAASESWKQTDERGVKNQLAMTKALLKALEEEDALHDKKKLARDAYARHLDDHRHSIWCFSAVAAARHPMRPHAPEQFPLLPSMPPVQQSLSRDSPMLLRCRATAVEEATAKARGSMRLIEDIYAGYVRLMADVAMHAVADLGRVHGEQKAAAYARAHGMVSRPFNYASLGAAPCLTPKPPLSKNEGHNTPGTTIPSRPPRPPEIPRTAVNIVEASRWYEAHAKDLWRGEELREHREAADARIHRAVVGPIEGARQIRAETAERRRMRQMEAQLEDARMAERKAVMKEESCCCINVLINDQLYVESLAQHIQHFGELKNEINTQYGN